MHNPASSGPQRYGGLGNDTLTGGKGEDAFVFNAKPSKENRDKVTDFLVRGDSLWLDNAVFKKLGTGTKAAPGKLDKGFLGIRSKGKNEYLIYNKTPASCPMTRMGRPRDRRSR